MNGPIDPRLRDALRGIADDAPAGDELWGKTEHRIAVHRRRRAVGSGLISAAAVFVIVAGVVTVTRDGNGPSVSTDDPATTTTSTTIAPDELIDPGTRVAAWSDGRIATLDEDAQPGEPLSRVGPGRFVRQLAVSPDGETLYYLVDDEPGAYGSDCATLLSFALESREITELAQARSFALSADGSQLALGMHADGELPCASKETDGAATIRVIATDDGSAQWEWRDGRFANVEALAWDPAGGRVAAEVCESTCRVAIVDETGALTGLFTPLEPADQTVSLAWGAAGLRTLEVCCRDPFDEGDTALRLRSIDPATGTGTELYVFEGEAEPTESELVAAGDDWFLLRRSASFDGVDAELSRIDLAADPAVERLAEGPTAIAEP